jgi:hypothetical protein
VSEFANIITLLEAANSLELQAIRKQFPSETELLSSARVLGERAGTETLPDRNALLKILSASIETERKQVTALLLEIRQKMVLVARTKLSGAIVSTTTGALSAVLSFAGSGQKTEAMITALLAMAGGLAAIIADYFERSPSGIRIASAEEYGKLVQIRAAVERMSARLARDMVSRLDEQEIQTMASTLDEFAGDIVRLKYA